MRNGLLILAALAAMPVPAFAAELAVPVGDFHSIALSGSADAVVRVGGAPKVMLKGPKALIDATEVMIRDGALTVRQKSGRWTGSYGSEPLQVEISAPKLVKVVTAGSGNITVSGINAATFGIAVAGSGDITASGTCNTLSAAVAGSGNIAAGDLKCRSGTVKIAGSGDVAVQLSEAVTAKIAGSGDIAVRGNPKTRSAKVMGSGEVSYE